MRTRPLSPRQAQRITRHTSCELEVDGKTHTGVITDLSATGIFIRTNATPAEGSEVRVLLRRPGGQTWELRTRVARTNARGQTTALRRGLGLEILEAPHAFHVFVSTLPS